jgi:hypothetical protein
MPISSTNRKAGPYIGNGTASVFPFTFKVFGASDLEVVKVNTVSGTEAVLVLNSDFTATLNADQDGNPGGSITLTAGALASGFNLVVSSSVAELQGTDLTNQGGFYPEVITNALDLLTILVQQLQVQVDRSLKFTITDAVSADLPGAAARAGKTLTFGADGGLSLVTQIVPTGTTLFAGVPSGTVNGVNKIFNLTNGGGSIGRTPLQMIVWQNFPLTPGAGYSLGPGAGQITYASAPKITDTLYAQGSY